MINRWLLVILFLVCGFLVGVCYAATEPTVLPFSPKTNASEPYDDEKFLVIVTPVINGFTDTQLNSSERMDAESAYYSVSSMKVSPEFYPIAINATRLLFKLVSSSEAYEESEKDSGLAAHNSDVKDDLIAQADADRAVAEEAFRGLTTLYPNSTLFG